MNNSYAPEAERATVTLPEAIRAGIQASPQQARFHNLSWDSSDDIIDGDVVACTCVRGAAILGALGVTTPAQAERLFYGATRALDPDPDMRRTLATVANGQFYTLVQLFGTAVMDRWVELPAVYEAGASDAAPAGELLRGERPGDPIQLADALVVLNDRWMWSREKIAQWAEDVLKAGAAATGAPQGVTHEG